VARGVVRRWVGIGLASSMVLGMTLPAGAQSLEDVTEAVGQVGGVVRQLPGGLDRGVSGPLEPAFAALAGEACDPTDATRCLLPFPNDRWTTPDATTPTGLRVDLPLAAMPRNVVGKPVDPAEWNRNDGFSPGALLMTHVPGLDLEATFRLHDRGISWDDTGVAQLRVPALSLADDAPIVLLDATTGDRHPYWAELDTHPDTTDDQRLLLVRPLTNLHPGHRYVVALRHLVDHDGQPIAADEPFATLRDELPPTACPDRPDGDAGGRPDHAGRPDQPGRPEQAGRPDHAGPASDDGDGGGGGEEGTDVTCPDDLDGEPGRYQRLFGDLTAAGVDTGDLVLAWDFTVASTENLTGRALAIRDQAFAALGDPDLADGVVAGDAPRYEITEVEERGDDLAIRGTITAPSFLLQPQDLPRVPPRQLGTGIEQAVPGSRLYYGTALPGPMDTPEVNPLVSTVEAEFACFLPHHASDGDPARPTLYGHGLLGGLGEVGGGSTRLLRESNHLICGTPWIGMATEDVGTVGTILADVSNFPSLPDRAQQGFLHFHLLGRLLVHPDGFAADPTFQDEEGRPRFDTSGLAYDGNSQGGIMGGALTALAPDFTKAVLGVPGGNYSTLLNRSVDWEGAYGEILYVFYPDKIDQQLVMALIQMLWDRAETNGYAHVMTDAALPNTPSHQVLLHVAYADHQVANVAAEVDARTSGARLLQTSLAAGRHWADVTGQRSFGLEGFDLDEDGRPRPHRGSAIVYVDSGNAMPPHGNVPPRDGGDPHGDPRSDPAAHAQRVHFFETGEIIDTRAGAPYWSTRCRGPHNPEACGDAFEPW
jgi:hypothetical protein